MPSKGGHYGCRINAERERSLAIGVDTAGDEAQAEIHSGAACHFADKVALTTVGLEPVVVGESAMLIDSSTLTQCPVLAPYGEDVGAER